MITHAIHNKGIAVRVYVMAVTYKHKTPFPLFSEIEDPVSINIVSLECMTTLISISLKNRYFSGKKGRNKSVQTTRMKGSIFKHGM